jgi:2-succinyl-5-enolpyruvyl-6-hydroxy-3-cyclohexene-1-carboxylate synthase
MSDFRTPAAPLRALVEELVGTGVRHAVICPGSRSTPISLALAAEPVIRTFVVLDERSAAYFALGLAKATRRAVAVVATSGTAVANFMPAVIEAREARVPLLLLTADRPPELRDRGAPQTIDQVHLYGRQVKWFAELPVPDDGPVGDLLTRHLRAVVGRAVATAEEAPRGPVHLNLPFREPLVPDGDLHAEPGANTGFAGVAGVAREQRPSVELAPSRRGPAPEAIAGLASRIRRGERGLIVCGPLDLPGFADAAARLAAATGFPILADGLANLRNGDHDRRSVVARHDALLRVPSFTATHGPDLVIRFGGTPASKPLIGLLDRDGLDQIVVDDGGWIEPSIRPATVVHADPVVTADALAEALGPTLAGVAGDGAGRNGAERADAWLTDWLDAGRTADAALADWLAAVEEPFEGSPFDALAAAPDGTIVFAGNSMPVRDLDAFLPGGDRRLRTMANRGANGIDGVVSTALGVAAAGVGPVVLVVGDLSFLHDLNALVAARLHGLSATIVLVNNDGGGIFSFLPQAATDRSEVGLPEQYERLFGTPHGIEIGPIVAALGGEHVDLRGAGPAAAKSAIAGSIDRPGVRVLELRTDRARNVELHRAATASVAEALAGRPLQRSAVAADTTRTR